MPERPVWENLSVYSLPVVYGHQHSGQPTQCLDGLVTYAAAIADRSESYAYDTPEKIMRWLYRQPVVLDLGEEPHIAGCHPMQRSRIWPTGGLNCWEAVAHLLGVAFRYSWPIEYHIYDARIGRLRHVFPAIRPIGSNRMPEPLVIQPPLNGITSLSLQAAQADEWYNKALGAIHFVGDKVLRVFNAGELADSLADMEGDELPDWARTAKQKEARASALLKQAAAASKASEKAEKEETTPKSDDDMKRRIAKLTAELEMLKTQVDKGEGK